MNSIKQKYSLLLLTSLLLANPLAASNDLVEKDEQKIITIRAAEPQEQEMARQPNFSLILDRPSVIDFSCCSIDGEKASKLAKVWKGNTRISQLNLNHNKIDNEGIKDLAEAFKTMPLTQLHVSNNSIDEGLSELFTALKKVKTLAFVDFKQNKLKLSALRPLIELLESNPTVTYHFTPGKEALDEILKNVQ